MKSTAVQPAAAGSRPASRILLPKVPVIVPWAGQIHALTAEGELAVLSVPEAQALCRGVVSLVCHAPRTARALGLEHLAAFDVLELFAFAHPAEACAPTPAGLARALNLLEPVEAEDACLALRDCARHLLAGLAPGRGNPAALAAMMGLEGAGWPWAPAVLAALGRESDPPGPGEIRAALKVWERLPEWSVHAPEAPPAEQGVTEDEARARLETLLGPRRREDRPQQGDYAAALSAAFAPREEEGQTRVVLAEAGTGTGKTAGYLAPATVWAEKNGGAVWISTYTRNLQRQVETALDALWPDPVERAQKAVVRKGRENYLCLLNLEDATASRAQDPAAAVALGLILRWATATGDGDFSGRDFPGWLPGLIGRGRVLSLADRRGECLYAGCPHFDRCFIEKSVRKSKRADIVIANHALVMHQVANAGPGGTVPSRVVFDEGHHVFDAADGVFGARLTGMEAADLRRWLLGAETQGKSRMRGLSRRLEDIAADDDTVKALLERIVEAARILPGPGWLGRLNEGAGRGHMEAFLALVRAQVLARAEGKGGPYSMETAVQPPVPGLAEGARALRDGLEELRRPMAELAARLERKLADEAEELDTGARERLRHMAFSLSTRAAGTVVGWAGILDDLAAARGAPEGLVDWAEITRIEGREADCGLHRRHTDPAAVFAAALKPHAAGVAFTSATLRDVSEEDESGWRAAMIRAGATGLAPGGDTALFRADSPFDHAERTKVFVVGDVRRDNADEAAAAFRVLFSAAGGGALGLFTAVQRLKAVHARLKAPLAAKGIDLYAQHADGLDTATLIDLFREEEDACLLGTDAARDGIDVPGRALRLVVYDRVPWPRPDILHKARRAKFGRGYDDMIARARLKQAYGRLLRRTGDRGVFVVLDAALPSRLLTAFPEGVEVVRCGLKEAALAVHAFLLKSP